MGTLILIGASILGWELAKRAVRRRLSGAKRPELSSKAGK